MLRGVRYPIPGEEYGGSDGVTVEFWRGRMYGETWSPTGGAPKLLVNLGKALIEYCDTPDARRAEVLMDVEKKCQALERYLDRKSAREQR